MLKRRSYDRDTVLTEANCVFGGHFTETYEYNDDARLETVTTSIVDDQSPTNTTTLTRSHAYDDYGRPASTTYPSSVKVAHEYNERGYMAKLKHGATALVEVTEQTAYGQSKAVSYGNGVETERSYDELGRLKGIETTRNRRRSRTTRTTGAATVRSRAASRGRRGAGPSARRSSATTT